VKGETVVYGYFDQTGSTVDGNLSVIDYIKEHAEQVKLAPGVTLSAEQFLERFLFPREMQTQALHRLSGGELRRLTLVRLLATAPNFLLLDEPTNDLDLDTIRLLEEYLADFSGCILLVSHDRALLDRLTDYLFIFDGRGGIRGFTGNYEEYRALLSEEQAAASPQPAAGPRRPQREKKATLSFKERQEYAALLSEIEALEKEQKELEAGFQKPDVDPAETQRSHRRYQEVLSLLQQRLARWEELAARAGE
jgi:ATP-binding cassette subfamily F protein uup